MKKQVLPVLLALMLTLSACGSSSAAAELDAVEATASALAAASSFSDVPADVDYAQAVEWCRENGILNGVDGGRFDPEGTLTRAMAAVALYRAAGEPASGGASPFMDTPADAWYADAVAWANGAGIVRGYGNGLFGPYDPVSVGQLEVIVGRYLGDNPVLDSDPAKVKPATRVQVAVSLYNALKDRSDAPVRETGRILVAYFSCTGSTKSVAETVQTVTGGDLFEIVPAEAYTNADLNYNTDCRANAEQRDDSARPAIAAGCVVEDMNTYDVVFLGYPIWWGIPPKIVRTFVESYDLGGKTIVPFCTSGS